MLKPSIQTKLTEAGVDEAGRGCLAGPVFAAAVVLPKGFRNEWLNDSKQLTASRREALRTIIEQEALAYAVARVEPDEIDRINILKASIMAMHIALSELEVIPKLIAVDGNRFYPYQSIKHQCVVKGDGKYMHIAAASILAKTYRDAYMDSLHEQFPEYGWLHNKGYGTRAHVEALAAHGPSPHHRKSFVVKSLQQMRLF